MQFLKSLFFNFFLYFGIVLTLLLAIPTLLLPDRFALFFGKLLAKYIIFILKLILNTKVVFHGLENLKKKKKIFCCLCSSVNVRNFCASGAS